ncbi:MAG: hypothetical protein GY820_02475 [Gammaproteobacteria bacterium]|nr:hypothetical protein [Gammaproteobacteria bacterium]
MRIPRPEVGPMTLLSVLVSTDGTFILSLLTFTATLSLARPHSSCMDARPEAHAGMKDGWLTRSQSRPPHQVNIKKT